MFRQLLLVAALVCLSYGDHAYTLDDIPPQFKELMPANVKNFLNGLSVTDKAAIMEIAKNCAKYKTEEEALDALKAKAPELGARVEKFHDMFREKYDALQPEAKEYVKEVIAVGRKIHASIAEGKKITVADLKENAQKEVERYRLLSEPAKKEIRRAFPVITSFFKSRREDPDIDKEVDGQTLDAESCRCAPFFRCYDLDHVGLTHLVLSFFPYRFRNKSPLNLLNAAGFDILVRQKKQEMLSKMSETYPGGLPTSEEYAV
ncbi:nematode fatty acid retinoid binding protein [Cooperia oncophora]